MRLIVIGLLIAAAIWVFVVGFRNRKRISWFGIFVMLIPAGVLGYFEYVWVEAQKELTLVVQDVSEKKETNFQCQRISTGFFDAESSKKTIQTSATTVELKAQTCVDLLSWYNSEDKTKVSENQMLAIHYFGKEIMRVAAVQSDDVQECLAVKNTAALVQKMGGTPELGKYISAYYVQELQKQAFKGKPVRC